MTLEIELGCLRTTATLLGDKPFICTLYSSVSDVTIPQSQLLVVVRVFLDLHHKPQNLNFKTLSVQFVKAVPVVV